MRSPWMQEQGGEEEAWSDREAWRGDLHADAGESWWGTSEEPSWEPAEGGEVSFDEGWPETLAGPEYWMFKNFGMQE